jgi:hypothetical protein
MKNASYRLLQWVMLGGIAASIATACVVSEGDGDDDDTNIDDAGESSGAKAGRGGGSNGGAGGSKAGSTSGGMITGGSSGAPSDGGMPAGGASYEPGLCEENAPIEPTMVPSCDLNAADDEPDNACRKCMKTRCCTSWKTCYGEAPTTACGWGATEEAAGQFDCVVRCFFEGAATAGDSDALFQECGMNCGNQCGALLNSETNDLLACAYAGEDETPNGTDDCSAECFPFE